MSARHWLGCGSGGAAVKRYSGSVKESQSSGEAGSMSPSDEWWEERDQILVKHNTPFCFFEVLTYWSQSSSCRTTFLSMGVLSRRHFHPASPPTSGQRTPSPEPSSDGASPALPGGMRSSVLPWLNGPALYVSFDSPYLDPEARSGIKN